MTGEELMDTSCNTRNSASKEKHFHCQYNQMLEWTLSQYCGISDLEEIQNLTEQDALVGDALNGKLN